MKLRFKQRIAGGKIPPITQELFHNCAIWAYWEAMSEGKHNNSEYVRKIAYKYYEEELKNASRLSAVRS